MKNWGMVRGTISIVFERSAVTENAEKYRQASRLSKDSTYVFLDISEDIHHNLSVGYYADFFPYEVINYSNARFF